MDPQFTPVGRVYVNVSPWIPVLLINHFIISLWISFRFTNEQTFVIVQTFIDKVYLYKVNFGQICFLLDSVETRCQTSRSAAPVQDLSEQLLRTQISLLVLYLDWEFWNQRIQSRIYHASTTASTFNGSFSAFTVILAAPGVKGLSGVGERTGGVLGSGVSLRRSSISRSESGVLGL